VRTATGHYALQNYHQLINQMAYTGTKISGDINDRIFWEDLHEKMSDLAKHTPNGTWHEQMQKVAEASFTLAKLHKEQELGADEEC
jgi:hypothetical protein